MNQVQNELKHYGVLGMKWGKRRSSQDMAKGIVNATKKTTDYAKAVGTNVKDSYAHPILSKKAWNESVKSGSTKDRIRRSTLYSTTKEIKDANKRTEELVRRNDEQKAAKKEHKTAIKETARELNKQASIGEKLLYNNATRKKAAKYIVDNNMTVAEATKKAKGDAWRNTAMFVSGYGAIHVANLAIEKVKENRS